MDQTVNLTSTTSVVRIHLFPPRMTLALCKGFCVAGRGGRKKPDIPRWFARGEGHNKHIVSPKHSPSTKLPSIAKGIHLFHLRFRLSILHHEKGLTFCQSLFVTVEVEERNAAWLLRAFGARADLGKNNNAVGSREARSAEALPRGPLWGVGKIHHAFERRKTCTTAETML